MRRLLPKRWSVLVEAPSVEAKGKGMFEVVRENDREGIGALTDRNLLPRRLFLTGQSWRRGEDRHLYGGRDRPHLPRNHVYIEQSDVHHADGQRRQ